MSTPAHGDRLQLLFDWAHEDGRRLVLWTIVAIALHAGAWLLFQTRYPHPEPTQISDATLYMLRPGSPEAARLAPLLASADPALAAPERDDRLGLPEPAIPEYQPSYAVAAPELVPLPDPPTRLLPPLLQDFGPVPMNDASIAAPALPPPATATQVIFSAALQNRTPSRMPAMNFSARPGDQLAPSRFLLAVASDGRVLHVVRAADPVNESLDDAVARRLMGLSFAPDPGAPTIWGVATFYWGLDVRREEPPAPSP